MKDKKISPKHRIHEHVKRGSEKGVHKARKLFGFKYPKLILLVLFIALAYFIFKRPIVSNWILSLHSIGYLGTFIAGILFSFGFTTPFSIGFLLKVNPGNIFLATIIGGVGSVLADMLIFKTIKFSFMDEFRELEKTKVIKKIEKIIRKNKHILIKHYLLYIFAGIILATPLPDEIGISMLAGLTTIKPLNLAIISFFLHAIPIFLLIYSTV
jgi:uncharacterized membrane protein YdjX (TVP38/TMEM64 family)